MEKHYLYFLSCPYTKQIRYIGISKNPYARFAHHIQDKYATSPKDKWIKKLKEDNKIPLMTVFAEVSSLESALKHEIKLIYFCTEKGYDLLNSTFINYPPSPQKQYVDSLKNFKIKAKNLKNQSQNQGVNFYL